MRLLLFSFVIFVDAYAGNTFREKENMELAHDLFIQIIKYSNINKNIYKQNIDLTYSGE